MLKSFKSLFDSVNATRFLIHSLLKMSLREQRMFTGWAKFSLKSEMRRHYEQMISAFSRVANHDLNLDDVLSRTDGYFFMSFYGIVYYLTLPSELFCYFSTIRT